MLFPIFILKVCYLKGHLQEKDEVVKEEIWQAEVKGQEHDIDQEGQSSAVVHFFGHLFWLRRSPDDLFTLTWTATDHLLIKCVYTHKNVLFLFVHTTFFFFSPRFFFSFFLSFFFDFLTHFWEILRFKNGRPILSTPTGHFLWLRGDMDCGNTIERPLGLLCAFLYVCVCAHMCACMCDSVCVDVRMCRVAHKYTVQYGFRYLPLWRINAWTEPWQGANISETITLYSVDNC